MAYDVRSASVADGDLPLHTWTPDTGGGPAIVLVQEIFGVEQYLHDVAARLTDAGYVAVAPELYWRFAPGFVAATDESGLQEAFGKVQQLDRDAAVADVLAAIDAAGTFDEVTGTPGVIGFCLGGTLSFAAAIGGEPAVCVPYYGSGVDELLPQIDAVTCPTLFHYGNQDEFIPAAHVEAVNDAIAGRPGFVLNVENAGHAFDNHTREMFHDAEAAQVAWAKTMAFVAEHLPT